MNSLVQICNTGTQFKRMDLFFFHLFFWFDNPEQSMPWENAHVTDYNDGFAAISICIFRTKCLPHGSQKIDRKCIYLLRINIDVKKREREIHAKFCFMMIQCKPITMIHILEHFRIHRDSQSMWWFWIKKVPNFWVLPQYFNAYIERNWCELHIAISIHWWIYIKM